MKNQIKNKICKIVQNAKQSFKICITCPNYPASFALVCNMSGNMKNKTSWSWSNVLQEVIQFFDYIRSTWALYSYDSTLSSVIDIRLCCIYYSHGINIWMIVARSPNGSGVSNNPVVQLEGVGPVEKGLTLAAWQGLPRHTNLGNDRDLDQLHSNAWNPKQGAENNPLQHHLQCNWRKDSKHEPSPKAVTLQHKKLIFKGPFKYIQH